MNEEFIHIQSSSVFFLYVFVSLLLNLLVDCSFFVFFFLSVFSFWVHLQPFFFCCCFSFASSSFSFSLSASLFLFLLAQLCALPKEQLAADFYACVLTLKRCLKKKNGTLKKVLTATKRLSVYLCVFTNNSFCLFSLLSCLLCSFFFFAKRG